MAKILLYTDPHFCSATSVVRGNGDKYSIRIEKIIDTIEWINAEAKERNIDEIICLGDFFDTPNLNAEEITAINTVDLKHHKFIVGNHDAVREDLTFNSINIFKDSTIYAKPSLEVIGDTQIVILPYVLDSARKEISEILEELEVDEDKKIVILSHNDVKGIQYGNIITRTGYDKDDIISNSDLFINGHIHTGGWMFDTMLNLGSVTGVNFNSNAFYWKPVIGILDTDTLEIELIENPHALLFYKLYFQTAIELEEFLGTLDKDKYILLNAKLPYTEITKASEILQKSGIQYSRLISDYMIEKKQVDIENNKILVDTSMNYYDKFKELISKTYEGNNSLIEELEKIIARG